MYGGASLSDEELMFRVYVDDEMKKKLRPHRLIQVRILGDLPAVAAGALMGRPQVMEVKMAPEIDLPPDTLRFAFTGDDQELSALLADLIRQGIPIVSFGEETGDLEDVFLQVTQGIVS